MSNNIKKIAFFLLVLAVGDLNAQITLEKAVGIAIRSNKGLASAEKRVAGKDYSIQSAYGRLMPTVNFDISYNYIDRDIAINLNPIRSAMIELQSSNQVGFSNLESLLKTGQALSEEQAYAVKQGASAKLNEALPEFEKTLKERAFPKAQLTFQQPIFTGGKILAGIDAAKSQKKLEQEKLFAEKDELVANVVSNYITVLLAEENLKVRQKAVETVRTHNKRAEGLLSRGLIAPHDKLRADVALSEAERNLFEARELLKIAKIAFNSSLDTNGIELLADSLIYRELRYDIDYFLSAMKGNNHTIKQINAGRDALNAKTNAEFGNYFPTVYGFGMYDVFDNYRSAIDPKWAVGIGANFILFNGLRRSNDYQEAKVAKESMDYFAEEAERKIELLIRKLYMEARLAEYQYLQLSSAISQAEENYRLNEKRYETGLGTSIESLDARLSLEAVELKKIQALKEYYSNIALLYQHIGKADEFLDFWNN